MNETPNRLYDIKRKSPRNRDADRVTGAIVKRSDDLLLVQHLTRAFDFDGYFLLRRDQVLSIDAYADDDLANRVLHLQDRTPCAIDIPIETIANVLGWLRKAGEVCTVEIPEKREISYVGYVRLVTTDGFEFQHLKTDGSRGSIGFYGFRDWDCIGFMGGYERALMLYDVDTHGGPPA